MYYQVFYIQDASLLLKSKTLACIKNVNHLVPFEFPLSLPNPSHYHNQCCSSTYDHLLRVSFTSFTSLPEQPSFLLASELFTPRFGFGHWDARISTRSCTDDGESLMSGFVALVRCTNVPDIGFEWITTATNAHFGEVADCIFCFRKA